MTWLKTHWKANLFLLFLILFAASSAIAQDFENRYARRQSQIFYDRGGAVIGTIPNELGYFVRPIGKIPPAFIGALLAKEDKYFYKHLGVNPISVLKRPTGGSSTLTQQLAKVVLGNEQKRNVLNKITETFYAISLEIWKPKSEVLKMYANSVYLGNLAQGFEEGAYTYFNKPLAELSDEQITKLLRTLSNPANRAPKRDPNYSHNSPTLFEIKSVLSNPVAKSKFTPRRSANGRSEVGLTIDGELTEKIRGFVAQMVEDEGWRGVTNGVVIVIKQPENEILAIVGSPDPESKNKGAQINMALEPRPIGSTIKPFIYARAFEKGMRPYSTIEDREYKYSIGTGFALYPKNYDGKYRGVVSAAESLANSLNVPAVKTLEHIGLPDFYQILENKLGFKPLNPLDSYQLGIALGGLEMDPLTLAYYFSTFANSGNMSPLSIIVGENFLPAMVGKTPETKIFSEPQVELVNKILSDRALAVDQFGLKSNLNLPQTNYAVKTGTSRDYHDSWTVGWTPDYVVLAWVGNAENKPLSQVSGAAGAGLLWKQTMELLLASDYNKNTPFNFSHIKAFDIDGSISFGLPGDNVAKHKSLLAETNLIISPHEGDVFELTTDISIPLEATESVRWYANPAKSDDRGASDTYLGSGPSLTFSPSLSGRYNIRATNSSGQSESVSIAVEETL